MIALTFLIGVLAGLRALTPVAVVSWTARLGWIQLHGTWLAFLGTSVTPYIVSLLALGELITDKLPKTPSRKTPVPFGTRIVTGAVCGAALGTMAGAMWLGLILGAVGAIVGTLGGAAMRAWLARAFGKDFPAALVEDLIAIGGAIFIARCFA